MKAVVRPELPTASVGSPQAPTAAVDNSAPRLTTPESTYKSGKSVQTTGATSELHGKISNLSNHFTKDQSTIDLHGKFMGGGGTNLIGTFYPENQGPDFYVQLDIHDTKLTSLNDLFRSYGRFDVAAGTLSVYSQATVQHGQIRGYVKPLFAGVEIYDQQREQRKSLMAKAKEALIGTAAKVLTNRSTGRVATNVNISGDIDRPQTSTWQALLQLVRNGFIKAILPGFDRQASMDNES